LGRLVEMYPGAVACLAGSRFSPAERQVLATLLARLKLRLKRRSHALPGGGGRRKAPRHGGGGEGDEGDGAAFSSDDEHEADLAAAGLSRLRGGGGGGSRSEASDELRVAGRAVWPWVRPEARGLLAAALLAPPDHGDAASVARQPPGALAGRAAAFVALRQVAAANWAR
jgi:hypothetical protein